MKLNGNMESPNLMLHGMRIIENPNLLVPGEPKIIVRTWKERIFSLPWRPWRASKTIIPMVPSKEILQYGNRWIMHPSMAEQIKREL